MQQILFFKGPFMVTSLSILMTLGIFISVLVVGKLAQKHRLRLQFLLDIKWPLIIGTIFSSRLFAIIDNYQLFFNKINLHTVLNLFAIWDQEMSFWGGIFGFAYVLIKNCQSKGENIKKWGDVFMVGLIVLLSFRNIGNFLDGSNYGKPTESFLGVVFNSQNIMYTSAVHPTQLYATAYTLLIALFLHWVLKKYKNQFDGLSFLLGAVLFSLFRFLEGFLRGDDVLTITSLNIRVSQVIFFLLFIYFSKLLYIYQTRNKVPFLSFYEKLFSKIYVKK